MNEMRRKCGVIVRWLRGGTVTGHHLLRAGWRRSGTTMARGSAARACAMAAMAAMVCHRGFCTEISFDGQICEAGKVAHAVAALERKTRRGSAGAGVEAWLRFVQGLRPETVTAAAPAAAHAFVLLGMNCAALQLFNDAAGCFAGAYSLTHNETYRAYQLWARARAAQYNGELGIMADAARAALDAEAYTHAGCHHLLALEALQHGQRARAREHWLKGLQSFVAAGSCDEFIEFLDDMLPYMKLLNEADFKTVYDTLELIIVGRGTELQPSALQRALQERIKLERLFGRQIKGPAWRALLAAVPSMGAGEKPPQHVPPVCTISSVVQALEYVRQMRAAPQLYGALQQHAAGEYEEAARAYGKFIATGTNEWAAVVDGCTARFLALGRHARVSMRLSYVPAELDAWLREAIEMYAQGKAGPHAAPVFAQCLLVDAVLAAMRNKDEHAVARFEWACNVAPSSFFPVVYLAAYRTGEALRRGALAEACQYLEEARALERMRPTVNLVQLAERLEDARLLPADVRELAQRDQERLLLWMHALDDVIMDMSPAGDKPGMLRPAALSEVPCFSQVLAQLHAGASEEREGVLLRRLYDWLGRFGATIPALSEYATLLRETVEVREELAASIQRTNAFELVLVLTACGDAVPPQVYCVCDCPPYCVQMQRAEDGTWRAHLKVPPELPRVRFRFSAQPETPVERVPENIRCTPLLTMGDSEAVEVRVRHGFWNTFTLVMECAAPKHGTNAALWVHGAHGWPGQGNTVSVALFEDGTHGDVVAGDGIWSRSFTFSNVPARIRYMYSAMEGPARERRMEQLRPLQRSVDLASHTTNTCAVRDMFGIIVE